MKKKKTFVLMVSKVFPSYHPKKGELTYFKEAIEHNIKIHTIRSNFELWKNRIELIKKGEAVLSVRQWSGKPYKSKQIELFQTEKVDIQYLQFKQYSDFPEKASLIIPIIENKDINKADSLATIAKNDGLDVVDFISWFFPDGLMRNEPKEAAIIHFTNFKY